jgi:hypothetical protein
MLMTISPAIPIVGQPPAEAGILLVTCEIFAMILKGFINMKPSSVMPKRQDEMGGGEKKLISQGLGQCNWNRICSRTLPIPSVFWLLGSGFFELVGLGKKLKK